MNNWSHCLVTIQPHVVITVTPSTTRGHATPAIQYHVTTSIMGRRGPSSSPHHHHPSIIITNTVESLSTRHCRRPLLPGSNHRSPSGHHWEVATTGAAAIGTNWLPGQSIPATLWSSHYCHPLRHYGPLASLPSPRRLTPHAGRHYLPSDVTPACRHPTLSS